MDYKDIKANVLRRYPKAIVHMKSQFPEKFGFVFGAGLSSSFKVPTWKELVDLIAKDSKVSGEELLKDSADSTSPFQTQMLFEHYRKQRYGGLNSINSRDREREVTIIAEWLDIIRNLLYKNKDTSFEKKLAEHPYFNMLIPAIKKTKLTVNYNFDDLIEKALFVTTKKEREAQIGRGEDIKEYSRGYESVTNASLQFRSTKSIIYHPNGIIPERTLEIPSDRFIFSEHEFADQILDMLAGDFSTLLNHFSKNTCLFIGLSLDDQTLRNLLRQTARLNPGHYHYYVKYITDDEDLTEDSKNAILFANFKVYNLITLFLNAEEIAAITDLINMADDNFHDFAQEHGVRINYPYYLTGPLGVGKSTSIAYFRNLVTYDEWIEPRLEILSKPWQNLTAKEQEVADNWIINQFKLKNDNIRHKKYGLILLDRGPLDPLAFTKDEEWSVKAKKLLAAICPGKALWKVEDGCIILLSGDPSELALRLKLTKRTGYNKNKLIKMEKSLKKAYDQNCISIIDTKNLSPAEVAQRIAEIIHLDNYEYVNLHERLQKIGDNTDISCDLKKD